jgi:hypothetical protein
MYSACLYCHAFLGANDVIEAFPVGRCLGFDAEKGRLWVVCVHCRRWNLSPLEERWEAVEACEKLFRESRRRVSTGQVGLAQLAPGLMLIRIGHALRPELAAWRYGRALGSRRLWTGIATGIGLVGAAGVAAGGLALGLGAAALCGAIMDNPIQVVARVQFGTRVLRIRRYDVSRLRVLRIERRGGYSLLVHHAHGVDSLHDEEAASALGAIMPAVNRFGAGSRVVDEALSLIERSASVDEFVGAMYGCANRSGSVDGLPAEARLALEMALHEETERRAMHGHLAELERAWRAAEEIAAIADSLLVPTGVVEMLERMRSTRGMSAILSSPGS